MELLSTVLSGGKSHQETFVCVKRWKELALKLYVQTFTDINLSQCTNKCFLQSIRVRKLSKLGA